MEFRRGGNTHPPIYIYSVVELLVTSFKILGIHISQDLSWPTNCSNLVKKVHQHLFFFEDSEEKAICPLISWWTSTTAPSRASSPTVWHSGTGIALCLRGAGAGENCPMHCWSSSSCYWGHLQEALSHKNTFHLERLLLPSTWTVCLPTFGEALQQHMDYNH